MPNYEIEPCFVPVMKRLNEKKHDISPVNMDLYERNFLKSAHDANREKLYKIIRERIFPSKPTVDEEVVSEKESQQE